MYKQNQYCLVFAAVLSLCASSVYSHPPDQNMDAVLSAMKALKDQYRLPSLSLAIGIGDKVVFAEAIGHQDIHTRREADASTQYSIGSIAKSMTGIALAKLVDMGKVDLDAPVSNYVDTPAYTQTFTVRELASHVAGVPHDTPEREIAEFVKVIDHESPFESFSVFSSHPLLFAPGTAFEYSSNGYILLSAVIESAAGMSYLEFLESTVWSEFGMNSTALDTSVAGKDHETTYYAGIDRENGHVTSETKRDRSFLFGAGGFISTPSDLVKMARATYPGEYLSARLMQEILTPTELKSGEVNPERYSLGWRVGEIRLADGEDRGWSVLHHGGVTDEAATGFLLVVPDCRASIAFTTNYVPEEFWKMRSRVAEILKMHIDPEECSEPV